MSSLFGDFRRFVAQTSEAPIGIEVSHARGAWIFDTSGRRYLDLIAGIGVASVGHAHPGVVAAIEAQARRHLHVMVYGEYVQEAQVRLARRLASVLPEPLSSIYFTSSGAEAIEGSLKTARKFTGRQRFVAFGGGYHIHDGALSLMATALSHCSSAVRVRFRPGTTAPLPPSTSGRRSSRPVGWGVRALAEFHRRCGALHRVSACKAGRSLPDSADGRLFGCRHWDVVPDLLVMAGAGRRHALGVCRAPRLMATLARSLAHVTTFGGTRFVRRDCGLEIALWPAQRWGAWRGSGAALAAGGARRGSASCSASSTRAGTLPRVRTPVGSGSCSAGRCIGTRCDWPPLIIEVRS